MEVFTMSRKDNEAKWFNLINEWKDSDLSVPAWCTQNKINPNTFKYWIDKTKTTNEASLGTDWVAVKVEATSTNPSGTITLKIGCLSIELAPDFDKAFLIDILKVAKEIC